jgi:1-acyl-sn-glycerol-3-phosphate acyltransferase
VSLIGWLILVLGALVALGFASRAFLNNPRADAEAGLIWNLVRLYSFTFHHLRIRGREHRPSRNAGPLIIVANHTSGVDPLLIASACPCEIRWVMAQDMRHPLGEWVWRWNRVIFVNRETPSSAGTREAIQHLREGGVLGVFPEGGIERPRGHVLPFLPGVGFLIKKTGALVLPIVVEGTPDTDPAWHALRRSSRSVVTFKPTIDYTGSGLGAAEIAEDLRERFVEWVMGRAGVSDESAPSAAAPERTRRRQPA